MVWELMAESLKKRFLACVTIDDILRLAKKRGIELTDDDVATIALAHRRAEHPIQCQ